MPEFIYSATHVSKHDGSDAMLVCRIGKSYNYPNHALFANENGDKWTDTLDDWEQITTNESGN